MESYVSLWCIVLILVFKIVVIFGPSKYHMDLCNDACSFVGPSCMAKSITAGYFSQTFPTNSFIPDMVVDTVDLNHFMPWLKFTKSVTSEVCFIHFSQTSQVSGKKLAWYKAIQIESLRTTSLVLSNTSISYAVERAYAFMLAKKYWCRVVFKRVRTNVFETWHHVCYRLVLFLDSSMVIVCSVIQGFFDV